MNEVKTIERDLYLLDEGDNFEKGIARKRILAAFAELRAERDAALYRVKVLQAEVDDWHTVWNLGVKP